MEVEQHDLSLEVGEFADVPLVVEQRDVDEVGDGDLRSVYFKILLLCLHDALILHAFQGDVVQVQPPFRSGIVSVPACCHGCVGLNVFL